MARIAQNTPRGPRRVTKWAFLTSVLWALFSAGNGLLLAMHYPLAPVAMTALFVVSCAAFFSWPHLWLLLVPALLPLIGLSPWTGWMTFEETDILILAAACGGYAKLAWISHVATDDPAERRGAQLSPAIILLLSLFAASTAMAMFRGFADAGGFSFGWYQGYHDPMNSARIAKSFFEAMLLIPLWSATYRRNPERATTFISQGLMFGLAGAALTTIWERSAFTGLLNFSTDYRTTGMFWEMHVGGAALDGFLAITIPFALRELMLAKTPGRWGVAATVLALAAYACLTTFSRGVYLAIPIGLMVFLALHTQQAKHAPLGSQTLSSRPLGETSAGQLAVSLCLILAFGVGAGWVFQTSGYRGMAALLSTAALMLPLARFLRGLNVTQWLLSVTLGTGLAAIAGAVAWLIPKGAYFAWGLAFTLTVVLLIRAHRSTSQNTGPFAFAGFSATAFGAALIANHWGGNQGLMHAAPVLLGVFALTLIAGKSHQPLWPETLRGQGMTVMAMGMTAATIAVFGGGAYMSERFSTSAQDMDGRQAHWKIGLDMLHTPADWWLGKGLGRFPANYFLEGNLQEHPGDYRLRTEDHNQFVTIAGGLHINGWGEIFRVSQRISEPGVAAILTAKVRAEKDVQLHFEVCEKHLLYNQNCIGAQSNVKGTPGVWQPIKLGLSGQAPTRGDWFAPRLIVFSMAMDSRGGAADIDNLGLMHPDGRQLLANGEFSDGLENWFSSSDRHHLPWHIKSILMNVLFDQGLVGLSLWSLVVALALWRVSFGTGRGHALAPALAASLTGFLVVGMFDSLLDAPRLAWLFYFLLLMTFSLRRQRPSLSKTQTGE
jgi:hypothetical protein